MLRAGFECAVEGGGASGEADFGDALKPFGADVRGVLNVVGAAAELSGGVGELRGVVGVFSTDGEDELDRLAEFVKGALTVFGGLADGVVMNDFDFRSLSADFCDEVTDAIDGLGGLRDDAKAFDVGEVRDFARV